MEPYFSPRVDALSKALAPASMEEIADALARQNDTKLEILWSVAGNLIEERGRGFASSELGDEPFFHDPNQLPLLREVA